MVKLHTKIENMLWLGDVKESKAEIHVKNGHKREISTGQTYGAFS